MVWFVALFGVAATIIFGLMNLPLTKSSLETPIPSLASLTSKMDLSPLTLATSVHTPTARFVEAPSITPTVVLPEFGYSIVDRDEVFSLSPKVKVLGDLSREKYTPEDRNAINRELLYTIDGSPDLPMFWRWYWCAKTKEILNQNMREIDVIFEADGRVIPKEQLASTDYGHEGGWCFTYSTILRDWKPGVYHLVQTTIVKSSIHDGQTAFPPGYKKYDFTIKIHPTDSKLDVLDAREVPMVLVQGSRYKYGDIGLAGQSPDLNIYLDSFYIDKFEVTNALYKICINSGACQPPPNISSRTHFSYYEDSKFDNYPVINVDWDMANSYCAWRGARLPTEAEWEVAARGVDKRTYPWGNNLDCSYANYTDSSGQACFEDVSPVDKYDLGISPFGVYGLSGNVWEWVNDWYSENYYPTSFVVNPQGPKPDKYRVIRGGAWDDDNNSTLSRNWHDPALGSDTIGFRCAADVP
jgi:formylglycine-generating enzyme required for sulfatase activity